MSISVTCPSCGEQYELAEELAGRKAKCQSCGSVTVVPKLEIPPESSVRRESSEFTPATADWDRAERIAAHIEQHCGKFETVWQEKIPGQVAVDLHWVKPGPNRPFHMLVTSGMSELPMTVPEGAAESRYAELCLSLPADWPMTQEEIEEEQNCWPLLWLQKLARFPHENRSWLGEGHTVPNGDPPKPFAAGTKLCCALIGPPTNVPDEFVKLELADRTIHFLGVHFLYREEMNFKLHRGTEKLFKLFAKRRIPSVLDPRRPNACRPWWKLW